MLTGEPGYSVLYRTWARPTLEVHGVPGGFVTQGAKTVIPAKASAKVSMRLVPNQDLDDILKRYTALVKKLTPKGIDIKIQWNEMIQDPEQKILASAAALHRNNASQTADHAKREDSGESGLEVADVDSQDLGRNGPPQIFWRAENHRGGSTDSNSGKTSNRIRSVSNTG